MDDYDLRILLAVLVFVAGVALTIINGSGGTMMWSAWIVVMLSLGEK